MRSLDFWPRLLPGAPYAVVDWAALQACADGSAAASCGVTLVQAPASLRAPVTTLPAQPHGVDPFTPTLTVVLPVCPTGDGGRGAALIGELDKFATVSVQRFVSAECTAGGLSFVVAGQPGEAVRFAALAHGALTVSVLNATLPGSPGGTLACTLQGAALSCAAQA